MLRIAITYLLCSSLLCCINTVEAQKRYQDWTWGGMIDPLQSKYEVMHYDIDLRLLPESEHLEGRVGVGFLASEALDTLRLNLIDLYHVQSVTYDNQEMKFAHRGDTLDVYLPHIDSGEVEISYGGITPKAIMPPWKGGFSWAEDKEGNYWVGFSCQGEGAKIFMPCLDHPSSEAWEGIDLTITVPKPYYVAANGRLVNTEEKNGQISYHWATDYPINNYGINFTMGIFHIEQQIFTSSNGNEIPMVVYALAEHKSKAPELLKVLERSTRTHEKYFGPFPFPDDKIAVVETPYLGMEHQTINAYGNKYRFEKVGNVEHDWLLHHELGHEWWGNMVSVKDWADFWMHEGLTTYGDWLFYEEYGGMDGYRKEVRKVGSSILNLKPVVAPDNTDTDAAFHIEIYYKGAFIIHSLRFIIGDEVFFPMIKAFLSKEQFTYDSLIRTEDFTQFVQEYSGLDLEGFFNLYLYTTKVPEISVKKQGRNNYYLSIPNIDFTLPVEIKTDQGIKRIELSSSPVKIESGRKIVADPNTWFLKEISFSNQ